MCHPYHKKSVLVLEQIQLTKSMQFLTRKRPLSPQRSCQVWLSLANNNGEIGPQGIKVKSIHTKAFYNPKILCSLAESRQTIWSYIIALLLIFWTKMTFKLVLCTWSRATSMTTDQGHQARGKRSRGHHL